VTQVQVQPGESRGAALEILAAALHLGLTSFGGPIAHLGYFRREYVERRRDHRVHHLSRDVERGAVQSPDDEERHVDELPRQLHELRHPVLVLRRHNERGRTRSGIQHGQRGGPLAGRRELLDHRQATTESAAAWGILLRS
jgi:hypothetical protein